MTPTASLVAATTTAALSYSSTSSSSFPFSTSGDDGGSGGDTVDSDAGASSSSSGSHSHRALEGGMIAIIVVVVLVSIFGITSTVLFVLAKRRQWNVRASVARASRRVADALPRTPGLPRTPRFPTSQGKPRNARLGGDVKAVQPPKRAFLVGAKELRDDVEKGPEPRPLAGRAPTNSRAGGKAWVEKLWGNGWK